MLVALLSAEAIAAPPAAQEDGPPGSRPRLKPPVRPTPPKQRRFPKGPSGVWVEIEASHSNLTLYRDLGGRVIATDGYTEISEEYTAPICRPPCRRWIPHSGRADLFFRGPGLSESQRFELEGHRKVKLKVQAGSRGLWILGATASALGTGMTLYGGLIFANVFGGSDNLGYGLIGSGLGVAISGVLLWVFNQTKVAIEDLE